MNHPIRSDKTEPAPLFLFARKEPSLEQLLTDPIVQQLMLSDTLREVISLPRKLPSTHQ